MFYPSTPRRFRCRRIDYPSRAPTHYGAFSPATSDYVIFTPDGTGPFGPSVAQHYSGVIHPEWTITEWIDPPEEKKEPDDWDQLIWCLDDIYEHLRGRGNFQQQVAVRTALEFIRKNKHRLREAVKR